MTVSINVGTLFPTRSRSRSIATVHRWPQVIVLTTWILIAVGVCVRISQFQANRSLWLDEVLLAQNIVERSYSQLLSPLSYNQEAPVGFLLLSKLCVQMLGNTEMAFRVVPFAASIAALPLFVMIGRRFLTPLATVIGLALLVFGHPVFRYSTEAKPYGSDVLWCLLILLAALSVWHERSKNWLWAYGLIGVVAVWFSYPSVFVLAGMGSALIVSAWWRGEKRRAMLLTGIAAMWVLSFAVLFFWLLKERAANEVLRAYWADRFMPFPPTSASDLRWCVITFFNMFRDVAGLQLMGLGAFAFFVGSMLLIVRNRYTLLAMLLSPIVIALGISALHLYPFGGRLVLFAAPLLAIVIAVGVDGLLRSTVSLGRAIGVILLALLMLYPMADMAEAAIHRPESQEVRPLMDHLKANVQPNDVIYIYHGAIPAFGYYADRVSLQHNKCIKGVVSLNDWNAYIADLEQVRGQRRVWVIMSHIMRGRADESHLFEFLLNQMGRQVEAVRVHEAALLLYDLQSESTVSEMIAASQNVR